MHSGRVHVIGRGFVGLSVAYELTRLGVAVTVVGPPDLPGSASRAAIGISSVKGQLLGNQPLFAAKLKGHENLKGWLSGLEKDAGVSLPRDVRGVIEPFGTMTGYDGIRERVFHRAFTGCHRVNVLGSKALAARFPSPLLQGAVGGFHYFEDLWFDPRAALDLLEAVLRDRGTTFVERQVDAIVPHPDHGVSLVYRQTPPEEDGIVPIRQVILAAGVFSRDILARSGVTALKLEGVPGDTLELDSDQPDLLLRQDKTNVVVAKGRMWAGSTAYREGEERPDPVRILEPFNAFLPANTSAARIHSGVRARFRDRCPAIGQVPLPGGDRQVWVALGFYKNGLQLGPLFAQKLATMVASPSAFLLDRAFAATRF